MTAPLARIEGIPKGEPLEVHSAEEFISVLKSIAESCRKSLPALVTVVRQDGDSLAIGLGRPYSVLSYVAASGDPPYFGSVGGVTLEKEVVFYFGGQYSEFSPRQTVSVEEAYEAVRRFVIAKGLPLPAIIRWEEV